MAGKANLYSWSQLQQWIKKITQKSMKIKRSFYGVVKWKLLSCVRLFVTPMDFHTVHGILKARILEWVAFPFFRGSSQPRYQTQVSHLAEGFFTNWATGVKNLVKARNKGENGLSEYLQ